MCTCNTCQPWLGLASRASPYFFLGGRAKEEGQEKIWSGTTRQLFLITWYVRGANLFLVKYVICLPSMCELAIMCEIGDLRRIYELEVYTFVHKNIQTLHLILCMSIAIVGGNKMQICETHAQCMRVGSSVYANLMMALIHY